MIQSVKERKSNMIAMLCNQFAIGEWIWWSDLSSFKTKGGRMLTWLYDFQQSWVQLYIPH
jgi:hypothetical protein